MVSAFLLFNRKGGTLEIKHTHVAPWIASPFSDDRWEKQPAPCFTRQRETNTKPATSLPEVIGQKKSKLFVYHQNGLPKSIKSMNSGSEQHFQIPILRHRTGFLMGVGPKYETNMACPGKWLAKDQKTCGPIPGGVINLPHTHLGPETGGLKGRRPLLIQGSRGHADQKRS